jgi:hypothetical protein
MKWKNHLSIAKAISSSMGLPENLERILSEGSIEPDRHPERKQYVLLWSGRTLRRVPHHNPDRLVIIGLVWKARRAHLEGDEENAMWHLGKALHYVQDACVDTGFLGSRHTEMEDEIGRWRPSTQAIEEGRIGSRPSPSYILSCIETIRPKRQAEAAVYQACVFSAAIAQAVLSPNRPEPGFIQHMLRVGTRHRRTITPLSCAFGASFVLAAFFSSSVLVALPSLPAVYAVQRLDREFYFLKNESRWFRL